MATTAEKITQAPNANELDIQRVFKRQQKHALALRSSTAVERLEKIKKLEEAVIARREDIKKAAAADFRKSPVEVDLSEIFPVVSEIKHTRKKLKKWMKSKRVRPTSSMLGTQARVRYEPRGVCLVISPWNYPINLTLNPLVSAIAAGNCVMIKPSEMTPNCSALLKEIISSTFDPEEVSIFEGDAEVSKALLKLPFDHIFFTGSPAIGKIVMEAASRNLTSVTLELGGKSPVVVDSSADLKKTARNIAWGKFSNNGQTCIAQDYLYVQESVKDDFLQEMRTAVAEMYGANAEELQNNPHYCRMVNSRHFERVKRLLDDAVEQGAQLVVGGDCRADDQFIAPTLLTNVSKHSAVMKEEIFGPVLPIISYDTIEQPIQEINSRPKPLAMYIYSKDKPAIERLLRETTAGGTCVNHSLVHYLHGNLPFGGVNNSGIGNSHGEYGFRAFSHERAVLRERMSSTSMLYPPYTRFTRIMTNLTLKFFS